jgi:hypothetical protein
MAIARTGRSSGALSRLLSTGRGGEKETRRSTREDQERGTRVEGLRSGLEGDKRRAGGVEDDVRQSTLLSCLRAWRR